MITKNILPNNTFSTCLVHLIVILIVAILSACEQVSANDVIIAKSDLGVSQKSAVTKRQLNESLFFDYAAMRAKQVHNVSYNLSFSIDNKSENFSGISEISFELANNNKNDLTIDFDEGTIKSIIVNGQAISFNYTKWFITIPANELRAGNNTVTIDYHRPYSTDGSGFHRFVDPNNGEVYLYTDFEPYAANRLFPHFDQPDLKASYSVKVNAPAHWQIISSTRETSIIQNGDIKIWSFPLSAKFSSYVFSLHAGNYAVWEDKFEDIPLRLFVRQSLAKYVKTEEWFTPTKQSFNFFNKYFDVRYPFGKYDQIISPDFNSGAMENVAAVTFNETYISRGEKSTQSKMQLANVIAHEMAHMWFGNLVTMRWWNGLWLNESFATYMANLEISKASDFENNWDDFYSGTKQWAYQSDDSVNTHAIELPVASTGDALTNFDGITYGKGASVLKQLPYYLGEENFRLGVSNYLKKFSYRNTNLNDFMEELGKAANKDLSQWTQDWLYHAGLNTIKVAYQCTDDKISQFIIKQTAPEGYSTLREQRVQIGLYNITGNVMTLDSSTPVTYKGKSTEIVEVIGYKCPDLVYPNEADWGYVKVELDDKSLKSTEQYINAIANPSMRLMLWQSLSDSVTDANLSADKFVNFAMANIRDEKDYNVVRKIASSLTSALYYLTTATRLQQIDYSGIYQEAENLYYELLQKAKAGSDIQKLMYSQYIAIAKTDNHLKTLLNILYSETQFVGLTIDQDKRWRIVAKLNRYQYGNYQALLKTEKENDITDKGVKYAIYSEVLRPEPEVKEKWFNVVINNPENLKLSTLRYIMFGLFPSEQHTLEAPFKAKILSHIPKLNEGGDLNLISAFTDNMLPSQCTSESEQELTKLINDYQEMKPQVLKTVKETHQEIERCIKALKLLK